MGHIIESAAISKTHNSLFIANSHIGDMVFALGVLDELLRRHPHTRLTVAAPALPASLTDALPQRVRHIDFVKIRGRSWHHWRSLLAEMRSANLDWVVDMRRSPFSRFFKAQRRFIPAKNTSQHKLEQISSMLGESGRLYLPVVRIGAKHRSEAEKILSGKGQDFLAIAPVAGWSEKCWPIEKYGALIEYARQKQGLFRECTVIFIGTSAQRLACRPLYDSLPEEKRILLFDDLHLLTIAAILQSVRAFIGSDSGIGHLAAAAGAPVLMLFGPSDERIYGPLHSHTRSVRAEPLPVRLPAPPRILMEALSVSKVVSALEALLAERSPEQHDQKNH